MVVSTQIDQFPMIQLLYKAYDDQGNFLEGLSPKSVQIIEDSATYPLIELEQLEPGVQLTIAFNPSPIFANYTAGRSNFEQIMTALQTWVGEQTARTPHDFSLVSPEGVLDAHLTVPSEWNRSLEAYQPNLMAATPSLSSLSDALSLAADAAPKPNMERAILFITPVLTSQQLEAIPAIIDRAQSLKVHVFIWLVGTPVAGSTQTAESLRQLADGTGGSLFLFSGSEAIPSLDTYFQPLRYIYRASYISGIQQSGEHQIVVQVNQADQTLVSEPETISVIIQPPNPIFLNPPLSITRTWTTETLQGEEILTPKSLILKAIVEFPDGYPRPLAATRFYVDGEMVDEKTQPPFDQFEWLLEAYTEDQIHLLKIEVVDSQGLIGSSAELPVEIRIAPKPAGWLTNNRLIVGTAVFGAAAILLAVMVLAGRRIPAFRSKKKTFYDPVTQPITSLRQPSAAQEAVKTEPRRASPYLAPPPPARLVQISAEGEPLSTRPIPLNQPETTFGSDPEQSIFVLDSDSVSGLHARIYRTTEGEYILADFGSTTGTWLNFAPVSIRGAHLENGDRIQIGNLFFRFDLLTTRPPRPPHVPEERD